MASCSSEIFLSNKEKNQILRMFIGVDGEIKCVGEFEKLFSNPKTCILFKIKSSSNGNPKCELKTSKNLEGEKIIIVNKKVIIGPFSSVPVVLHNEKKRNIKFLAVKNNASSKKFLRKTVFY